ncbi:MAG: HlyD family efflux transporter periplasmic adaptor subunit [Hydrogenophaga sp.]|nr:HlyD family efflux transporter periplasmic adaptor subunit [Hydrogenophaga sp.]
MDAITPKRMRAAPAELGPQMVLTLLATLLAQRQWLPAATALASTLASMLGCERVSVGRLDKGFCRVVAISHGGSPSGDAELLSELGAAMDEAIDQQTTLRCPPLPGTPPRIELAHQALWRRQGGGLCSMPLVVQREIVGALLFEFQDPQLFDAQQTQQCEHLISLLAPVLDLMRRNELPWPQRLRQGLAAWWRAPGQSRRRWVWGACVLALLALLFIPVPDHIGGQARIEGATQRSLVAPADGFIQQALVRPGDRVAAGQLLVEMADQVLLIDKRKWQSELAQHDNAYAAALARADRAQLVINQAKADEARAQIALIEQQLGRARIEAPFAGIVIHGDLSQSLGAPVQRGEALLTLAPVDQFRVIVEVDERDIAGVWPGQTGELALSALPWDVLAITVKRITPMATAVEGGNVFEVEAVMVAPPDTLKPGLKGVARIGSPPQPLLWRWTHRAVEWLALKAWAWWGI